MKFVSVFDGMSCGQISISKRFNNYEYFASEINPYSMKVTKHNFPNTNFIGNIIDVKKEDIGDDVFMLLGGSPCKNLSIAGKRQGMITIDNIEIESLEQYLKLKSENYSFVGESYLFWEYVRLLNELKPKYFLLENVLMKGKNKKWEHLISKTLGVQPLKINSSVFVPQNRERLYWTNIDVKLPINTNVSISSLIPDAIGGFGKRTHFITKKILSTTRKDNLVNCLTTNSNCRYITLNNGQIRPLTLSECESLQGVPLNYTNVLKVPKKQKFDMLGNGWTINVIDYILSHLNN